MKRTTIFLTQKQVEGLAQVAREDGSKSSQLIRDYINAGLARRKRQK
jgi:hypothetical protein